MYIATKKAFKLTVVALSITLMGCSMAHVGHSEEGGIYRMHKPQNSDTAALNQHIMQAGTTSGWKMTPFKSDVIIAEKIVEGQSMSVTVSFATHDIVITVESSDFASQSDDYVEELMEAINNED